MEQEMNNLFECGTTTMAQKKSGFTGFPKPPNVLYLYVSVLQAGDWVELSSPQS